MHVMKKKLQIRTSADESGLLFLVRLCELTDFGYIAREKCTQDCLELLHTMQVFSVHSNIDYTSNSGGLCLVTLQLLYRNIRSNAKNIPYKTRHKLVKTWSKWEVTWLSKRFTVCWRRRFEHNKKYMYTVVYT